MIIKLSKAEVKDKSKDGHHLQVTLVQSGNIHTMKSFRKIRHRVANFFGEAIQVPVSKNPIFISVDQIDLKGAKAKIMEFSFDDLELKRKQKKHDIMTNENQNMKLSWSWQIQVPESQMSSQFSRDIMNIETPKKQDTYELNDIIIRTYSPDNKRKHNLCMLFLDQSMSQKCDSSPNAKRGQTTKQQKQLTLLKLKKSLVKSKSAATRSKTPSKQQVVVNLKTPPIKKHDEQIKKVKQSKNKTACSPIKKPRKVSETKRKNNIYINKVGAVFVSTVGIFAGLFAGMAASM